MSSPRNIVGRLKREMDRRGLSQTDAAASLRVGLRTLHRWVRGGRPSPLAALLIEEWIAARPLGTNGAQATGSESTQSTR